MQEAIKNVSMVLICGLVAAIVALAVVESRDDDDSSPRSVVITQAPVAIDPCAELTAQLAAAQTEVAARVIVLQMGDRGC